MPEISVPTDWLGWLIAELRAFEMEDIGAAVEDDADQEDGLATSETAGSGDLRAALVGAIDGLSARGQAELTALAWTGRALEEGQTPDDYAGLVALAEAEQVNAPSAYLLGMPPLPDYLAEAADHFGLDVDA